MKQILQSLKTGEITVENIPFPSIAPGKILIKTSKSLISSGTEKMLINFGKASYLSKAKQQPDKVKMVMEKIKTDGLLTTVDSVLSKLDQPLTLGYCNVGKIQELGSKIKGFETGDRIVSNGNHAEFVSVPKNLCVKVPDNVTDDEAAFTVIGAVALQGIRLLKPTLGESFVVIGLGLVGLMAVQLLKANGCRVLGIDFDESKIKLAQQFGAEVVCLSKNEDPIKFSNKFSRGRGVDGVLLAAATDSSEPISQAAKICRKRGRVVLVGVTGLELSRDDFFKKEISFQVSSSYGPGRNDPEYEDNGHDYPFGFVRWTEQRNFEAVLDMMSDGRLNIKPLISKSFEIEQAQQAYHLLQNDRNTLGIILNYGSCDKSDSQFSEKIEKIDTFDSKKVFVKNSKIGISFIGAGNYASRFLIPLFNKTNSNLRQILSNDGVSSFFSGKKHNFYSATANVEDIFNDQYTDAVVIATRHDSHARYLIGAIESNKNVFVEKPLCVNLEELKKITNAIKSQEQKLIIMPGFNRRFAPHVIKIKELLDNEIYPKNFVYTVNAGYIPSDNWIHDPIQGGGRIIGEACHFIDLLRFLAGCKIEATCVTKMNSECNDTVTITMKFIDGSIGTIHYISNGHRSYPKESLEIYSDGKILKLDNFINLKGFGWMNFRKMKLWNQDKGQRQCVNAFIQSIYDQTNAPIELDEVIEVSKIAINIAEELRK